MSVKTTSSPSTEITSPGFFTSATNSTSTNNNNDQKEINVQTPAVTTAPPAQGDNYFAMKTSTTCSAAETLLPSLAESKVSKSRPRPMALDLSSAALPVSSNGNGSNSSSTEKTDLRTPPTSATLAHYPRMFLSSSVNSGHSKTKSTSLPTNNVNVEIPPVDGINGETLHDMVMGIPLKEDVEMAESGNGNNIPSPPDSEKSSENISPAESASSKIMPPSNVLIADVRPFVQYGQCRIGGSVNVCIPTTLLKRPQFELSKFIDNMYTTMDQELRDLSSYKHIILYDNSTDELSGNQLPLVYTLWKFIKSKAVYGKVFYLEGGLQRLKEQYPQLVDREQVSKESVDNNKEKTSLGGFSLPTESIKDGPMKAFTGNIRTAMETYDPSQDKVTVRLPSGVKPYDLKNENIFPGWLCDIINEADESGIVGKRFCEIELAEKNRLEHAFHNAIGNKSNSNYNNDDDDMKLVGVELGNKNRYKNIWPFDHSRVRVQSCSSPSADYINASRIHTGLSNKKYIATQGPLPATFNTFWKMVFDEQIPVIVMLTMEKEGGTLKCDEYWREGQMGDIYLKKLNEETVEIGNDFSVLVRRFSLTRGDFTHTVSQIQYTNWPDFGNPAQASDLLKLCQLKEDLVGEWKKRHNYQSEEELQIIVHCSAGCGRTGTFCTVDTCCDVFKREYVNRGSYPNRDIINEIVHEIRRQRVSMVQTQKQYAMCYETVIQWCYNQSC